MDVEKLALSLFHQSELAMPREWIKPLEWWKWENVNSRVTGKVELMSNGNWMIVGIGEYPRQDSSLCICGVGGVREVINQEIWINVVSAGLSKQFC